MVAFRDDKRFLTSPAHESFFEAASPVTSDRSFIWKCDGGRMPAPLLTAGPIGGRKMRKNRTLEMRSDVIRHAPMSVLVVLADADLDVSSFLSALRPHFALVCASPAQAVESAPAFEPDVVMVDDRIADHQSLIQDLARASGGRSLTFVALGGAAGAATKPGFCGALPASASAGELEQLLWRIRHDLVSAGAIGRERVG
jgi:hypothetical protein